MLEVGLPIEILPEEVSSAIAAGEVVERPASVVKELIENALDADAGNVDVLVERAGSGLIEVADDGHGIPSAEVPLSVARFATSKLRTAEDLFAIQTLGFRGEALSSIGAISRMELISRARGESVGSRLIVEGGETGKAQPCSAAEGTVVRVRDLFFNVPARRKFLKSETTERRRIVALVSRYALAYPRVRFRLTQEGRVAFQTSGKGDRREVFAAMYGVDMARQMIAIQASSDTPFRIEGLISPPSIHRGNRRDLIFFINGRWVQDISLATAVLQAYHALLMVNRYPMAVLFLELAPEEVDVNVHPAKAEVRFHHQDQVFGVLQRVVRAILLGQAPMPQVHLPSGLTPEGWQPAERVYTSEWTQTGEDRLKRTVETLSHLQAPLAGGELPLLRAIGQVGATYLVAEGPDGLYLIDQHAAHERVLYERMMKAREGDGIESQVMLEPATIEFSPDQAYLLEEQLDILKSLGFGLEPFGRQTFRLRSIPSLLASANPEYVLRSVVEDFEEDETPLAKEIEARIAARVCKRAAVKAGQILSLTEQQNLIRDLENCLSPRTCPHGRPTMIHLSVDTLERQFGRRG